MRYDLTQLTDILMRPHANSLNRTKNVHQNTKLKNFLSDTGTMYYVFTACDTEEEERPYLFIEGWIWATTWRLVIDLNIQPFTAGGRSESDKNRLDRINA